MSVARFVKQIGAALLAVLPAVLMMPASARADPAAGERLARQWCATCHVINAPGANTTVPQGPPSFNTMAQKLTPDQMRVFLARPHPPMPDLALTRAEIDDLISYIETLR